MTTKIFQSDKERLKEAVKESVAEYCNMIDCVTEPISLDLKFNKYGCTIRINAEV